MSVCDIGFELDTKWVEYNSTIFYLLKTDKTNFEYKTGKGWWSGTRGDYEATNAVNFDAFSGYGGEKTWMALKSKTASGFKSHSSYKSLTTVDSRGQSINFAYRNDNFIQTGSLFFVPTNCYGTDGNHRNAHTSSKAVNENGYHGIYVDNLIYTECVINKSYENLGDVSRTLPWFLPCVKSTISFLRGATSDNIIISADNIYNLDLSTNYYYQPIFNNAWYTPRFTVTNNNDYPIKITFDALKSTGVSMGKTIWTVPPHSIVNDTQLKYTWETQKVFITPYPALYSCTLTIEKLPNVKVKTTDTTFNYIDNIQVKLDDTNGLVRVSKMYVKENDEWKLIMEDST